MSKRILIATPMYGGNCSGIYAESLAIALAGLSKMGYTVQLCTLYNESLITRARNILSEIFLREKADYLLFIDADQSFNYMDIHKMILEGKDILSATVPLKQINWESVREAALLGKSNLEEYTGVFNFSPLNKDTPDYTRPYEVKYAGTGMILIKKEVFHTIKRKCKVYKHNSGNINGVTNGDLLYEFWATGISTDQELLSEDYMFCEKAKE